MRELSAICYTYRVRRIVVVVNHGSHRFGSSHIPYVPCLVISTVEANECPGEEKIIEISSERVVFEVEEHVTSVILHHDVEVIGDGRSAGPSGGMSAWSERVGRCRRIEY
jgi:hypothetical protein